MNAYTELINWIVSLLQSDIDVNTITEGQDIEAIDISKKNIYPLAHIEVNDATFNDNTIQFPIEVQILDQVDYNNEIKTDKLFRNNNRVDVYNTSMQSLRRLFNELKQNERVSIPETTATLVKVSDLKNNIIGYQMIVTVDVPNDVMSICQ